MRQWCGSLATLYKQANAAVLDPNIKQRFAHLGAVAVPPNSPDQFAKSGCRSVRNLQEST